MKDLYEARNSVELALFRGVLDAEGINYYVLNDNFGRMWIGPIIELYNQRVVVVQDEHYGKARELLDDFLASINAGDEQQRQRQGEGNAFWDKVRFIAEALVFGWIMPGSRRR